MKIAIVGARESKWTEEQKVKAKDFIRGMLADWVARKGMKMFGDGTDIGIITVVSGHCHLDGVDIWAEEIADKLGIKKEIYPAEIHQWSNGFKCTECQVVKNSVPEIGQHLERHEIEKPFDDYYEKLLGYHSRNKLIAKACDVLYDIEPKGMCRHCGGTGLRSRDNITRGRNCRYCRGTGTYGGGTWTLKFARKLGKEVHKIVIE